MSQAQPLNCPLDTSLQHALDAPDLRGQLAHRGFTQLWLGGGKLIAADRLRSPTLSTSNPLQGTDRSACTSNVHNSRLPSNSSLSTRPYSAGRIDGESLVWSAKGKMV